MRSTSVLMALPLVALAACNTVTTGEYGVLTFTPDECGGDEGCSLNDDLAVGATLVVELEAADGGDIEDLRLITSNPYVFQVERLSSSPWSSEWKVTGTGDGWAELVAIDGLGYEIDKTRIDVRYADGLGVEHVAGNAVGPTVRLGYDQVWTVNADERVELEIVPLEGRFRMMGRVAYQVDIDELLYAGMAPGSRVEAGELEFRVPMGEYDVDFVAPDGQSLRLLIVAQ